MFGEERCDAKHNVGRLQIVGYAVPVRHDGAVAHVGFGQGDGNLRWMGIGALDRVQWSEFNSVCNDVWVCNDDWAKLHSKPSRNQFPN